MKVVGSGGRKEEGAEKVRRKKIRSRLSLRCKKINEEKATDELKK
jgi:hypothetical protein